MVGVSNPVRSGEPELVVPKESPAACPVLGGLGMLPVYLSGCSAIKFVCTVKVEK